MSDKYISSININDVVYQVKDKEAREDINTLDGKVNSKIDLEGNSDVNGVLNFVNGVKVNEASITYSPETNTVIFE
jgi:hypothetical protein